MRKNKKSEKHLQKYYFCQRFSLSSLSLKNTSISIGILHCVSKKLGPYTFFIFAITFFIREPILVILKQCITDHLEWSSYFCYFLQYTGTFQTVAQN